MIRVIMRGNRTTGEETICVLCGKPAKAGAHRTCLTQARSAQCKSLNRAFYESWPSEFFSARVFSALLALAKPGVFATELEAGIQVDKLQLAWDKEDRIQNIQKLERWAKIEIATAYFHALETLLRLFLAHAGRPLCPWLEMANLRSFSDFKEQLPLIAKGTFPNLRREVACVIYGFIEYPGEDRIPVLTKEQWDRSVDNVQEHLSFFAHDLLDSEDYNAFKHGLAVLLGKRGFQLGDGQLIKREGDSLLTLVLHRDREIDRWAERVAFFDVDLRATLVYRAEQLIEQIIKVGKTRYIGGECTLHFFERGTIHDILSQKQGSIHTDVMALDLWPLVPRKNKKTR